MVHPSLELLTEPPTQPQIDASVDALLGYCNDPDYSVAGVMKANIENCVRVFSATGGSTNLVMHLIAAMRYAGVRFSLSDLETIIDAHPIPDLFDYSLTEGRDIFALAQQCCDGQIRGMETVLYEPSTERRFPFIWTRRRRRERPGASGCRTRGIWRRPA